MPGAQDALRDEADSTRKLLLRARAGDAAAVDDLAARYIPRLRRWARGRLPRAARERMDTDDLVQETLVAVMRRLGTFEPQGEGAFQAYVRQALLNRLRDEARRGARRPEAVEAQEDLPDRDPSPLEQAIGSQALQRYESALARLRDEDREAVIARVELGCSFRDVAVALGKPSADAARMAVSRALVRLAKEMAGGG